MATDTPTRNTPKTGFAPGAFEIKSLVMTNSGGATRDIRNLLESFSITEELYSPVLTFNGRFRDDKNFFSDFSISGQEIIDVKISKTITTGLNERGEKASSTKSSTNEITLKFYVKEYPNYTRTLDFPSVQLFSVVAISDFAYINNLKKISKSIKGNVAKNIQDIFSTELYREVRIRGRCVSEFDGIITIQPPLKALDWLRRRTFDGSGSPFFLYSTISEPTGKITLASWKEISSGASLFTYTYRQLIKNKPGTQAAYDEELSRILDMKSTIGLDKLKMANLGAYANKTYITDYAMKTYTNKEFDLKKKSKATPNYNNKSKEAKAGLAGYNSFQDYKKAGYKWNKPDTTIDNQKTTDSFTSFEYKINGTSAKGLTLYDTYEASQSFIQINTASADNALPNSTTGPVQDNINFAKSFFALMNESSHNVVVYGDLRLNPGTKIKIKIPKALRREANETEPDEDALLSGEYIITVASHTFNDGVYTSQLKLVKNNLPKGAY
jgi:hypothetical protein